MDDAIQPCPAAALDCFLIADDLTGACDAAVHFAMRGRNTIVPIAPGAELRDPAVIAVSTDSRDLEPAAARNAISAAVAGLRISSAPILFKKIDSTLRGHTGGEIAAALTAFGCNVAIVCPAFPRMNRIVEGGCLRIDGDSDFPLIEVASHLRAQGVEDCVYTVSDAIPQAICSGAHIVVLDAVCDGDLDRIAAAGLALDCRVLWAGSAGLASALARTLTFRPQPRPRPAVEGPVLFCIGSDHSVTLAQQTALLSQRGALLVHPGPANRACIQSALAGGQHVVLRIPHGQVAAEWLRDELARVHASAVLLSGGHTASLICRIAAVNHIDLIDEIGPGVPRGVIHGGALDGVSVVTKSGGFGCPDALIQVADYFKCLNQ